MALEDEIKALTAALNRNSDLLEGLTAKAAAGAAAKTSAPAEKPKDVEVEDAPRGRGRPPKEAAAEKPKAKRAPTEKEMADATVEFLEVDDDDEHDARRALVKRIIASHGVKKMSEIPEAERQKALDALTAYKAGDETGYEEESLA